MTKFYSHTNSNVLNSLVAFIFSIMNKTNLLSKLDSIQNYLSKIRISTLHLEYAEFVGDF